MSAAGWLYEYVGRHRSTAFPDSAGSGWIFSAYVGKHRVKS